MTSDTILLQPILCAEDWSSVWHCYAESMSAGLIENAIGHIGPPVLDFGYIVERNGLPVHYFVSNIYSLKVITNFIY
jgi:hypothetical protein